MLLDILAQLRRFRLTAFRERHIAARCAPLSELHEHVVKEEAQPDAFAFAMLADQIHAVVPVAGAHQRQAVLADVQAVHDRAHAVLVQSSPIAQTGLARS